MYRGSPIGGIVATFEKKEVASVLAIGASLGGGAAAAGLGFTVGTFAYAAVAGVVAVGIMVVGTSVLGLEPEAPDLSEFANKARGYLVNKQANDAFIPVVYGNRRVGGTIVFMEQGGENNKYLYMVIAIAEGTIDKINEYYFNDVSLLEDNHDGKFRLAFKQGQDSQVADADFVSELDSWTADHKLSGTACVYVRLEWDVDAYPQGLPVLTFDVQGKRVHDPRSPSSPDAWSDNPALCIRDYLTNSRYGRGIAEADIDDASIIAAANYCDESITHPSSPFSEDCFISSITNASGGLDEGGSPITVRTAVVEMYNIGTLRQGDSISMTGWTNGGNNITVRLRGIATPEAEGGLYRLTLIDEGNTMVTEGTAEAMVNVTFTPHLKRYTCNGVVDTQIGSIDVLNKLLTSCRGFLVFTGGKYKLIIDKPETASFAFTEDNIVGAWSIAMGSKQSKKNRIRAGIYNEHRQWQSDIAVVDSSTFRTADNGLLLEREIELPFTSDIYTAQEIATIALNQSRQSIMVDFTATIEASTVEVGDVVTITHSTPAWNGKEFRVVNLKLKNDGEVVVSAIEYDITAYNFTLNEVDATPNTHLPNPASVVAPTNFAWTQDVFYTAGFGKLSWTASADTFVDKYKLNISADAYVEGSKTPAQIAGVNRDITVRGAEFTITDLPAGDYTASLIAVNSLGVSSASVSAQFNIPVPYLPDRVSGLELDLGGEVGEANSTEWTGRDLKVKWRQASYYLAYDLNDEEPEGAESGSADWYHKDYKVAVYDGATLLREEFVTDTWYIYTYEKNAEDAAKNSTNPYRTVTIKVWARGRFNQISELPAIL